MTDYISSYLLDLNYVPLATFTIIIHTYSIYTHAHPSVQIYTIIYSAGANMSSQNSGYGSADSLDGSSPVRTMTLKRVNTGSSILVLTNVFNLMWKTLIQLTVDPFPGVNQQAGIIVNNLKSKVSRTCSGSLAQCRSFCVLGGGE